MAKKLVLKIASPGGDRREVSQEQPESLIIGSGPAAAVRVEDPKVAALHCMLKFDANQVTVIDLGTEGGTKISGSAVKGPTVLKAGDLVELGGTKVEVLLEGAKAAVKAEKKAESKPRPPPMPVGATVGRAARLFNEELPPEETPAPDDKQLEVALLWGDTIINVAHFDEEGKQVLVGSGHSNHFQVYSASVGESFPLAATNGNTCTLTIPGEAEVVLRRGDSEMGREQLLAEGSLKAASSAVPSHTLSMHLHDRVQVSVENTSFLIRWVRPHRLGTAAEGFDFYFTRAVTTAFMAAAVLLAAIFMTDVNAESLSDDLFKNPQRYAKLVIKPPEKEKKKKEVKEVKEQPKVKIEEKYGDKKDNKKSSEFATKREDDKKKVMNSGLLALLGGADGSTNNVFSGGGLGTGLNQALGSLKDSGVADTHGVGGLGSRGTGPGGGGTGLGLGGLGTKGGGRGSGGGFSLGGGKGKGETRVVPGKTTVTGSCERTSISKVISRHANEIRYCYETELSKDPNLSGKVQVSFTIEATGGVGDASIGQTTLNNANAEGCILTRVRRWKFPEPKGGGVCVINYPWVFKAAGAGGDDEAGE